MVRLVVHERRVLRCAGSPLGRLDEDDVGAHVGQELAGTRRPRSSPISSTLRSSSAIIARGSELVAHYRTPSSRSSGDRRPGVERKDLAVSTSSVCPHPATVRPESIDQSVFDRCTGMPVDAHARPFRCAESVGQRPKLQPVLGSRSIRSSGFWTGFATGTPTARQQCLRVVLDTARAASTNRRGVARRVRPGPPSRAGDVDRTRRSPHQLRPSAISTSRQRLPVLAGRDRLSPPRPRRRSPGIGFAA